MSKQQISVLSLFPHQMTGMGDAGNVQVVLRRAAWRNIEVELISFEPDSDASLLAHADLLLGEGGQPSDQIAVQPHLLRIAPELRACVQDGVPALVVGGMFELFGNSLILQDGTALEGAGVFNQHTRWNEDRILGNIVTKSNDFGELIGFENHNGRTHLATSQQPLATLTSGEGNNGKDDTEGARSHNALGTYLHGPLLPKNPQVADFLITKALEHRLGEPVELSPLHNTWLEQAREAAKARPR